MQCKIEVKDDTKICPLCHCVLEKESEEMETNMYPDVKKKVNLLNLGIRIYAFLAIVAEIILVLINAYTFQGTWWCIIAGGAMLYGFLTLRFTIYDTAGYKVKVILQTCFAIAFVFLLDYSTGYQGWSMNYVLPGALILIDVGIIVLMVVNYRNWQSYMVFQLFTILCSIAPLILYGVHIITDPRLGYVAVGFSILVFLGTLIVGGTRARSELKRRFHI